MAYRMKRRLESLLDHYVALCAALALVILSLIGVGDVRMTGMVGLLLCGAGMTQDSARVDLRILFPLILYDLAAMASSYMAYGNIVDGYGAMHALFPVVYLLMACLKKEELCLLKRCCSFWVGGIAAAGIGRFIFQAVTQGRAGRMSGLLGNSNAMGIFLVVGWFAVLHCVKEDKERKRASHVSLLEPVLLMALALTLSMGSFLAMGAGIGVLLAEKRRDTSWRETFPYVCQLLARVVLGMGTGILIYLAAARTSIPFVCLPLLAYGVAVMACWRTFGRFLEVYPPVAILISALGILVAAVAVVLRPSAIATFSERLEMMASGLDYLMADPLFGVGPLQWRLLDLNDGGKYFNTWHIHNIPIHIGVEMGWIAMAMVVLNGLCALCKKKAPSLRAGIAAFLFHNLIDTSFFYLGITSLTMMAMGEPGTGGRKIGKAAVKAVFALFAVLFAYSLFHAIRWI
ncbi:MAG: O-antigen ligase family protein [Lachnospiraceae bacterium]|nr:O-antigen ligase family protein [Lachnospiraceae bacterium]